MKNFQSNTFGIPYGTHLKTTPSPLKNTQSLPSPRILALATINMLSDGAKEIYQEENKVLRYELDMNFMPSASFVYKWQEDNMSEFMDHPFILHDSHP